MAFIIGGRLKELLKKYGKVGLGVHFSISAASFSGLYLAISNNVDVESVLQKVGIGAKNEQVHLETRPESDAIVIEEEEEEKRNWKSEMAASSTSASGALALALICNKALFPLRLPITLALTPPIARFLARRRIISNSFL